MAKYFLLDNDEPLKEGDLLAKKWLPPTTKCSTGHSLLVTGSGCMVIQGWAGGSVNEIKKSSSLIKSVGEIAAWREFEGNTVPDGYNPKAYHLDGVFHFKKGAFNWGNEPQDGNPILEGEEHIHSRRLTGNPYHGKPLTLP